jgi:hypothetical protein
MNFKKYELANDNYCLINLEKIVAVVDAEDSLLVWLEVAEKPESYLKTLYLAKSEFTKIHSDLLEE